VGPMMPSRCSLMSSSASRLWRPSVMANRLAGPGSTNPVCGGWRGGVRGGGGGGGGGAVSGVVCELKGNRRVIVG
jgi:hypothetical protein